MSRRVAVVRSTARIRGLAGLAATLGTMALMVAAVGAGAQTGSVAPVKAWPHQKALDYHADPQRALKPLSPEFIAETLGATFVGPRLQLAPPATAAVAGTSAPPTRSVSSPTFECVNGHQTADPLSPPCVARFAGDNGGATARGVTSDEVRILVWEPGHSGDVDSAAPTLYTPDNRLYDLDQPASAHEHFYVSELRLWQEYFNRHYQLYGRRAHIYVYFDGDTGFAVHWGAGEAADVLARVQPFAVLADAVSEKPAKTAGPFFDTLLAAHVVGFLRGLDFAERQTRLPGLLWSYNPTVDRVAESFASYACSKVVGHPVRWSGNAAENGRQRRIGILHTAPSDDPVYTRLDSLVTQALRRCGARPVAEATVSQETCGGGGEGLPVTSLGAPPPSAVSALAALKSARVTTVVWPGCSVFNLGAAATALAYAPEWIVAGDGFVDRDIGPIVGATQHVFDHHAVVVSALTLLPQLDRAQCYKAQREVRPNLPASYPTQMPPSELAALTVETPLEAQEDDALAACFQYPFVRQVFNAIQLAGPRLTPEHVAAGLYGLAYFTTPDPENPTCYYSKDDDSCVQDAIAEYWDGRRACWAAIEGGRRRLPGGWPKGNIDAQVSGSEPCNDA